MLPWFPQVFQSVIVCMIMSTPLGTRWKGKEKFKVLISFLSVGRKKRIVKSVCDDLLPNCKIVRLTFWVTYINMTV